MQMKLGAWILVMLLSGMGAQAQVVNMNIGPDIELEGRSMPRRHIHSTSDYHFLQVDRFMGRGNKRQIVALTNDRIAWAVDLPRGSYRSTDLGVYFIHNKIIWFDSRLNKKRNTIEIVAISTDLNGQATPLTVVAESKTFSGRSRTPKARVLMDENRTHLIASFEYDHDDKKKLYELEYVALDENFLPGEKKSVKIRHKQKRMSVREATISSKGKIYLTSIIYRNDRERMYKNYKSKLIADFDYRIVEVDAESQASYEYEIDVDGFVPVSQLLVEDSQGNMVMGGVYKIFKDDEIVGVYSIKLDPTTQEMVYFEKHQFSQAELAEFGKVNTYGRSKLRGINNSFSLAGILPMDDGGYYILIDEEYTGTTRDINGNLETYFVSNCIISCYANSFGTIESINIIPKFQQDRVEIFIGHRGLGRGKDVAFFYNDDLDNFTKNITDVDDYRLTGRNRETVAVMAILDKDQLNREILFQREGDMRRKSLIPSWTGWVDENHMVAFAYEITGRGEVNLNVIHIYL